MVRHASATRAPSHLNRFAAELHYLARFPTQNKVCRMRSHYCVLTVLGDLFDGGELHFLEAVQTLEDARQRIEALAEFNPGQ